MNNKIGNAENMKLVDRIILNGKVGYVNTGDENGETIGVQNVIRKVTFAGEEIVDINSGFPLTKEMEDLLGWGVNFASVRFVTADVPVDPTTVEEKIIESYYGGAKAEYYHRYTDLTGYLWTNEGFEVGGHDIPKILENYVGQYIHMEIELYKEN